MLGMIKKDLFMIKNNSKTLIVSLIIYVLYTIMFEMDMSFLLPFMTLMISLSTFTYDDYNNWHLFATSLPQGRTNVIKSKYITTIALIVITTIISILVSFIIGNYRGNLNIEEMLSSIMGELLAIIFIMSVLFPVLFKFGAEKGRIATMILGIGIMGLVILVTKVANINIPQNFIAFIDSYFLIIFATVSTILISVSYIFSKKIYLKREF